MNVRKKKFKFLIGLCLRMINQNTGLIGCFEGVCGLVRFRRDERSNKKIILEQIWKGKAKEKKNILNLKKNQL